MTATMNISRSTLEWEEVAQLKKVKTVPTRSQLNHSSQF